MVSSEGRDKNVSDASDADPEKLMTVREVAQALRLSKMTVYRLIHEGQLAAIQQDGRFRVPRESVRALLRAGAQGNWTVQLPEPGA
ncbi:hypothetical protein GCM10023321_45550 [Pseudonocardia eucalypti]|uniref:Helix-turn-helix domain-containing protein n=1 Tax=Pseudonocardia eucalypti TaxID=648755 RepID=A0ABP9QG65_9PSEU